MTECGKLLDYQALESYLLPFLLATRLFSTQPRVGGCKELTNNKLSVTGDFPTWTRTFIAQSCDLLGATLEVYEPTETAVVPLGNIDLPLCSSWVCFCLSE